MRGSCSEITGRDPSSFYAGRERLHRCVKKKRYNDAVENTNKDPVTGQQLGPRGGRTTIDRSGYRKQFILDAELERRLRDEAHESRRSQSEIVREALREYFCTDP